MTEPGAPQDIGLTHHTRRDVLRYAGAGAFGLALGPSLAGCGSASSSSSGPLRIGYTLKVDSLNPFVSVQATSAFVLQTMFPFLTSQSTASSSVQPNFASSWQVAPDGQTITFKTAPGGKWSDGHPLTARDAAFTINTIVNYQHGPAGVLASGVTNIKHASAPDDSTLVVTFSEPFAAALLYLGTFPILPEHVWGPLATGSGSKLTSAQVGPDAVSGGAFALKKFVTNEIALLEARRGHYGPTPHAKEIGFVYLASDAAQIQALQSNTVNVLGGTLSSSVPNGITDLKPPAYHTDFKPGLLWWDIGFNSNPTKPHNRELLDPRVRVALAHATDKQRIVTDLLFGHGRIGSSIVGPGEGEWYNSAIQPEVFDIDLANHILDGLGYKRSAGGTRMANGHPMRYTVNVSTDMPPADRIFQIVSEGWSRLGIQAEGKLLDSAAMVAATTGPKGKYLTNDIFMWDWQGQADPNFILGILTSSQLGAYSDTGFQDPEYDSLFAAQAKELDHSRRLALVHRMQEIAYQRKPYIVLCYLDTWEALRSEVKGLPLGAAGPLGGTTWPVTAQA